MLGCRAPERAGMLLICGWQRKMCELLEVSGGNFIMLPWKMSVWFDEGFQFSKIILGLADSVYIPKHDQVQRFLFMV